MSNCTVETIELGKVGRRTIEAAFDGGDIVSDGGVLLLRQVDRRMGLTDAVARVFADARRSASVTHSLRDMLAQRIYGLCCGWEDVSDHNVLRRDLALQTAVGRVDELASAPTLSRLETSATRAHAAALHGVLLDQFIASHAQPPKELILDIDATHVPLHGTELERACTATIRTRLLKIGAAIVRNTRRVRVLLASHHPLRHIFFAAAQALAP